MRTERNKTLALCAGVFVFALLVRVWTGTWLTDFWGDSYHHWLITRLTMLNGGVYTDYKGLEVIWSPLYHYLSIIPLLLSGRQDLAPLHWMNTLLGAFACAFTTFLAWRLYRNRPAALSAGALLAVMTWHIAFSAMNVAEVFSGVLVLFALSLVLSNPNHSPRPLNLILLFIVSLAMPLTRTDLSIYLGIMVLWLLVQKRLAQALVIIGGVFIALGGWSLWSLYKTGNFLHWYQQYAHNNLHDWLLLNALTSNAALTFAEYLNRLSPFVVPALVGGILAARFSRGSARRNLWLVTALLAGHSAFLILGYARGLVPILTERYLVIDLPLVALLMGSWIWILSDWFLRQSAVRTAPLVSGAVGLALVLFTFLRFWSDLPELEIRRWGIDKEWQIGNFLSAQVREGEVVLTDAPVAIYRSGLDPTHFVSSVQLEQLGDPTAALRDGRVRWIVAQPDSYDAASAFIPRALLQRQVSGDSDGLRFELVWRYDPQKPDIQSEVWHVITNGND